MWILLVLLVSILVTFGVSKFMGYCCRDERVEEYFRSETIPYRNSKGEIVKEIIYIK